MNEAELNDLSHAREPASRKGSDKHSRPSSTHADEKLPKFAEFAKGDTQMDAVSIQKYVARMVDTVFQVYDTDNSGSISVDEFETISSNFPFIQAFSDLDMDKDDVISKEEMTQYFLGAYQSLRRVFKHNFQECSYLSPTYCDHCKGRLIGYVRQGYKCKDCNINCHKDCKDSVVVECHRRDKRARWSKGNNKRALQVTGSGKSLHDPVSVYEDKSMASLKEKLARADEARDTLSAENAELHAHLEEERVKIHALQQHLDVIRGHTIGFILEQMNTRN